LPVTIPAPPSLFISLLSALKGMLNHFYKFINLTVVTYIFYLTQTTNNHHKVTTLPKEFLTSWLNNIFAFRYGIMTKYWQKNPDGRPTFPEFRNELKEMENQHKVKYRSLPGIEE